MAKHRTQLFLEEEQYRSLSEQARRRDSSISEVVRELIDLGLEKARGDQGLRLRALDELTRLGERIERRVGVLDEDPVAAVRAEREHQVDSSLARVRQR